MYGTVDQVVEHFPSGQYDPTRHEPDTDDVESRLTDWSEVLDGQIGNTVNVPVSETTSPKLHAICAKVATLRVAADIYDLKFPPGKGELVTTRQSYVWRDQAADLVDGITDGRIADGVAATTLDTSTPPVGYFGAGTDRFGERERDW